MKKSILNLGAQELTKNQQKSINGGLLSCGMPGDKPCRSGFYCYTAPGGTAGYCARN
ncbi:hypothetical protein [Flavobacterium sp.]|uniref:hypothetical protein n=1 Tax=Flavobacterium sp. TaxID=239 RepID=UPI002603B4BD|nr:hypothetical protein [Flavobacterium sp.]